MKTLNLTDIDKSDIKYQIQKFPDGQQNVVIIPNKQGNKPFEINDWTVYNKPVEFWATPGNYDAFNSNTKKKYELHVSTIVQIKSRLNNWSDLELIVCAVASLRNLKVKEIHLYVPYIMGARSDRKFEIGGNRYIKDVIAPVLNSLKFESVTCIDPHSYVLENCIDNFESTTNDRLVRWSLANIQQSKGNRQSSNLFTNCILVSPDDGASKKIYKLAEQIGYKGDIITCSKDRDTEGNLTKTVVPVSPHYTDSLKDHIIVDDICDGGATFINIAKSLKERYSNMNDEDMKGKIFLIVTHGIFSKGFEELSQYFDGIYCTNSYKDIGINGSAKFGDWMNFKQLNVF